MNTTTKFCKDCGKIMWDVSISKTFCNACLNKRKNQRAAVYRKKTRSLKHDGKPANAPLPIKSVKSIKQCVREAAALGITYGQYVARGLDKE